MRKRDEPRERGLPSLNEARDERRRAIVFGRARMPALPTYFWLWLAVGLATFGVVYWRIEQGRLESRKSAVMAKQRAVASSLGTKLIPFRDRMERWVQELASVRPDDFIADDASFERVSRQPGVYLRLQLSEARTAKDIRKAAQVSLRDGFASCLFVDALSPPAQPGARCRTTSDCESGFLCDEYQACVRPRHPYNTRLAYRALRVLSSEWTDELHQAESALAVQAYDRDLAAVVRSDVPLAIELLSRAKYFTALLDETPPAGLPAELPDAGESDAERLQRTAHPVRVGIWDLSTGKPVLRLRRVASGQALAVGERVVRTPQTVSAAQRQANNCALALSVKDALVRAEPAQTQ
ncbi:MAG TPA: hypothetical protein VK524_32280 [Polyangiaceae bacterium]|nr:hypothetical protein [Polyangiaceae bacterium]